jgi:CheY-like chemotaxis protein
MGTADLHGSELILLAEDDESGREMVRRALVNFGYRVLSASNGEEALRVCEKETPSLAILYAVMPHMGGAATAVELLPAFPGLPILFTSGYLRIDRDLSVRDSSSVLPPETL